MCACVSVCALPLVIFVKIHEINTEEAAIMRIKQVLNKTYRHEIDMASSMIQTFVRRERTPAER